MFRLIDALFAAVAGLFNFIAIACLVLMTILVDTEIVLRTVFNGSTRLADEYSGYFFCWMALLGLLAAARDDRMLKIDYGLDAMSPRVREVAMVAISLVGLFVASAFAYSGYLLAAVSYRFQSITAISETLVWKPQTVLPVAFGVLALFYAFDAVRRIARLAGHPAN